MSQLRQRGDGFRKKEEAHFVRLCADFESERPKKNKTKQETNSHQRQNSRFDSPRGESDKEGVIQQTQCGFVEI